MQYLVHLPHSIRLCCVLLPAGRTEGIPYRHYEGSETHSILLRPQGVGEDTGEDGRDGQRDYRCQEGESEIELETESESEHPHPPSLLWCIQFQSIVSHCTVISDTCHAHSTHSETPHLSPHFSNDSI